MSNGIENANIKMQKELFGKSEMNVPIPNILTWFQKEIMKPMYLITYFSMIIWVLEKKYLSFGIILIFTLWFTFINFLFFRRAMLRVKKLTTNEKVFKVFRKNNFENYEEIKGNDLVSQDIFLINIGDIIPCDCILIKGIKIII